MCVCPSGYVDDGSGGCTSVPGMFTRFFFNLQIIVVACYFDLKTENVSDKF